MPYGIESRDFFAGLVDGKPLRVLVYNTDLYGRAVADVYVQGTFVQVQASLELARSPSSICAFVTDPDGVCVRKHYTLLTRGALTALFSSYTCRKRCCEVGPCGITWRMTSVLSLPR